MTDANVWHINADKPDLIDYDTSFKQVLQDAELVHDPYRSSDPNPVINGLTIFSADMEGLALSVMASLNLFSPSHGDLVTVKVTLTLADNFDQNPQWALVDVSRSETVDAGDIV